MWKTVCGKHWEVGNHTSPQCAHTCPILSKYLTCKKKKTLLNFGRHFNLQVKRKFVTNYTSGTHLTDELATFDKIIILIA